MRHFNVVNSLAAKARTCIATDLMCHEMSESDTRETRMALSTAHTSAEAADTAKLLF